MTKSDDLALAFLKALAEGSAWEEALRDTGLDDSSARSLLSQVVSRVSTPSGRSSRRRTRQSAPLLPAPPKECPFPPSATVVAHADGASRGNPGPASYGCVYLDEEGHPAWGEAKSIGVATNNVAEYRGCLAALERLVQWGVRRAVVRLDSQLVVRQLSGQYRVKDATLKGWYDKVRAVAARLEQVRFEHVPRKDNAEADRMANSALDAPASG